MRAAILTIMLLLSLPSGADEWTTADTQRERAFMLLHTIDWAQTRNIARNPDRWTETNSVLGAHPSVGKVDAYFISMGIAHVLIASALPEGWREAFQYITFGEKVGAVASNYSIGVKARF